MQTVNKFNQRYHKRRLHFYIISIVLSFLLFILFLGGNHSCLHVKSKYKEGKGTLIILSRRGKCRLWRETNTFQSFSSFTDCVFSIFRRKKYASNPSEVNIKVVIPAPTEKIYTLSKDQSSVP